MSTESGSKNIHVFRVNRLERNKDKTSQQKASPEPVILTNTRTCLSAETKRQICEDHINNPKYTQESLALKYGCKRTTVAKIIKSKERWLSIDSNAAVAKRYRQRSSRYPLVENALKLWLQNEQQDDLENVTDQMLRCRARQYAQTFSVEGLEDFKASSSWVSNFKQRYLIPKLQIQKGSDNVSSTPISVAIPNSSGSSISSNEDDNPAPTSPQNNIQEPTSASSSPPPPPLPLLSFRSLLPPISSVTPILQEQTVGRSNGPKRTMEEKDATTGSSKTNGLIIQEWNLHSKKNQIQPSRQASMGLNHIHKHAPSGRWSEPVSSSTIYHNNSRHRSDSNISDASNSSSDSNHSHLSEAIPDMMDYTDDFDTKTHCFDNNGSYFSSRKQLGSVSQKLQEKRQRVILPAEDSKLTAKKHLEAALDFYTSQHGGNSSMSANMIKLILQNDF